MKKRSVRRVALALASVAIAFGLWLRHGLQANAAPHHPTPRLTRGAYASPRTVADAARWWAFLQRTDSTVLNTVVIDLVSPAGVHFQSGDRLARRLAAPVALSYPLAARVAQAHARRLFVIGRVVAARNPRLVRERPEWAIGGGRGRGRDGGGRPPLDVTNEDACEFLGRVSQEAARAGVDEIMLDELEVPAGGDARRLALTAGTRGQPVHAAVTACARIVAERVRAARAKLGIAVPGRLCADVAAAGRNGQRWEDLALVADRLSPEVYPQLVRGPDGRRLTRRPYDAVSAQVALCYTRNLRLIKEQSGKPVRVARIEPWVQAYSVPGVPYGPVALGEELRALREHGVGNALLWNGESDYDRFVPALRGSATAPVVAYNPSPAQWARAREAPLPGGQ